jgi:predicted metal-binding protein
MARKLANRLLVCATCERQSDVTVRQDCANLRVALELAGLSEQIEVVATPCLGGCVDTVNIALQGEGRGTYVFDGLEIKESEAEIVKLCQMFLELKNGWIEDARPLGELRNRLRARIPTMN